MNRMMLLIMVVFGIMLLFLVLYTQKDCIYPSLPASVQRYVYGLLPKKAIELLPDEQINVDDVHWKYIPPIVLPRKNFSGTWHIWDGEGTLSLELNMENGFLDGKCKVFTRSGNVLDTQTFSKSVDPSGKSWTVNGWVAHALYLRYQSINQEVIDETKVAVPEPGE